MATIKRFEEIEAWQVGRSLVNAVYALTKKGGFARDWGLRDQIQRAANLKRQTSDSPVSC